VKFENFVVGSFLDCVKTNQKYEALAYTHTHKRYINFLSGLEFEFLFLNFLRCSTLQQHISPRKFGLIKKIVG